MKNAMKRVMSILLVAMLLVSALPLAASAKSLMDNLNALPGQETKATQPAATQAPAATEAPAAPVVEAPAAPAPAAPAAAAFTMMRTAETPVYDAITINYYQVGGSPIPGVPVYTETAYQTVSAATLMAKHFGEDAKKWSVDHVNRLVNNTAVTLGEDEEIRAGWNVDIFVTPKQVISATIIYDSNLEATATVYGDSTTVPALINAGVGSNYEFQSGKVMAGDTLYKNLVAGEEILPSYCAGGKSIEIVVTRKSTTPTTATTTPTTATTTPSGSTSATETTEYYNKFPYNVYLNIYKDTMVGAPDKTINITKGAAIDGTVTMDEVKALVMNHYKAKDSYGISFDGLYLAEGTWVTNYVTDTEKYDKFIDVDQFRQYRTVYINVMIDNATAKSSSSGTADTSNPKTGDSIYAPIAVLGVSATALAAAMFFYNKKRLAK